MGGAVDGGAHRRLAEPRERTNRADQHVAGIDESGHRRGVGDVGRGDGEITAQPGGETLQAGAVAAGQHGRNPRVASSSAVRVPV